ncbi:MAG: LysE family translocator [Rhizobiaceae bacterium]
MPFIPDASVILPFAVAVVILAITPGPDMTLFVGRTLSEGRAAGLACMFGSYTGILVHTLMVTVGLSALILASPRAFLVLKVVGAAYLVWLAVQAVLRGSAFSPDTARRPARPLVVNWVTGIGINLLNPKIVLFYVTFLPQFVSAGDPHAPGKLLFLGLLSIAIAIPITTPMVLAAGRFSALMKRNPRVMRAIDWLFAGVFSAFAVKILLAESK